MALRFYYIDSFHFSDRDDQEPDLHLAEGHNYQKKLSILNLPDKRLVVLHFQT